MLAAPVAPRKGSGARTNGGAANPGSQAECRQGALAARLVDQCLLASLAQAPDQPFDDVTYSQHYDISLRRLAPPRTPVRLRYALAVPLYRTRTTEPNRRWISPLGLAIAMARDDCHQRV